MTNDKSPIEQQALVTAHECQGIVVATREECDAAATRIRAIAALQKEVATFFAPMKEAAYRAHREITEKEKLVLQPLEQAKQHLSRQIGGFQRKEEEARKAAERELQRRAQEAARKKAEEEAKKREEEAIRLAAALEESDRPEEAEQILTQAAAQTTAQVSQAVARAPAVVLPPAPKVDGIARRENWKFEITDPSKVPDEFWQIDERLIGARVRLLKGKCQIEGVRVYCEDGVAVR